jgi:hypothetical protein
MKQNAAFINADVPHKWGRDAMTHGKAGGLVRLLEIWDARKVQGAPVQKKRKCGEEAHKEINSEATSQMPVWGYGAPKSMKKARGTSAKKLAR